MRWIIWNAVGCVLWVAGLTFVKGPGLLSASLLENHQLIVGVGFGIAGLVLLMWSNFVDAS